MNNQIEKYALDQFGNLKPRSEVLAQEKHKAMLDGGLNSNKQGQETNIGNLSNDLSQERHLILEALKQLNKPLTVNALEEYTNIQPNSLRNILSKMVKQRQLKRVKRGTYALVANKRMN